jgi:hypothetical protein
MNSKKKSNQDEMNSKKKSNHVVDPFFLSSKTYKKLLTLFF